MSLVTSKTRDYDTTTMIRKLVFGQSLYNSCITNKGKVARSTLEHRLKQLQSQSYFKDCSVEDLAALCSLKEFEPMKTTNQCIDDLEKNLHFIADSHYPSRRDVKNYIGYPLPPFRHINFPYPQAPAFLLRDKNSMPYRECDVEPQEEVKHPDTSPTIRIQDKEKEALLEHYVCDLKQATRTPEVEEWIRTHPTLVNPFKYTISYQTLKWHVLSLTVTSKWEKWIW